MRYVSGFLRLLCGLAIMGLAGFIYLTHETELHGTHPGQLALFGTPIDAEPQTVLMGIAIAAGIGLLLVIAGLWTLVHTPTAHTPASTSDTPPPPAAR